MGSVVGTIGGFAGLRVPGPTTFLAVSTNYVLTSFPPPPGGYVQSNYIWVPYEYGWTKFNFQLVVGNATLGSIQINVTNDQPTAQGVSGANVAWEPMPAPAQETTGDAAAYSNPLVTATAGAHLMFANSGPWAAWQIAVNSAWNGTTGYLLFGAAP